MLILGIDPGSRRTGWGVVQQQGNQCHHVASGTLTLDATAPLPERLLALTLGLERVLEQHRPDQCALEQVFSARYARSALVLGQARGAILATVARTGLPIYEYAPTQIKQAVVGAGRAEKDQVARMVAVLLGYRAPLAEDEADALAVALTHGAAQGLAAAGRPDGRRAR
jgi:crossover junction endodeoxyribonuclease RuvC